MYREILTKRNILESRKPYNPEIRRELKRMELLELIYTSLHLDGSGVKKEDIQKILDGEFVAVGTTVNDHLAIQNYIETISFMGNLLDMDSEVNFKVIEDLHDISCGGEGSICRRSNPILYTFDYNPPHWQEVRAKMEELIRWIYDADVLLENNKILKAVIIHNKIVEIYPFEYNCESTARLVMYYALLKEGYPIFELRLSEAEYNNAIIEYLKTKKTEALYSAVERSIYNKLDVILQLTETD